MISFALSKLKKKNIAAVEWEPKRFAIDLVLFTKRRRNAVHFRRSAVKRRIIVL